ncbi:MAG: hypothetical protein J7L11_03155 [Thermoprotei archaeon]|nr:hypothetical protein [Thermoprotei archaeon]
MSRGLALVIAAILVLSIYADVSGAKAWPEVKVHVHLVKDVVEQGGLIEIIVEVLNLTSSERQVNITISLYDEQGSNVCSYNLTASGNIKVEIPVGLNWDVGNYTLEARIGGQYSIKRNVMVRPTRALAEVERSAVEVLLSKVKRLMMALGADVIDEELMRDYNLTLDLYDRGNYSGAFSLFIKLMGKIRERAETLGGMKWLVKGAWRKGMVETRTHVDIERHLEFLKQLNMTLARLEDAGFNVTEVKSVLLNASKELMKTASSSNNKTDKAMAGIACSINKVIQALKRYGNEIAKEKIKREIQDMLNSEGISEELRAKLEELQDELSSGDYKSLKEVVKKLNKLKGKKAKDRTEGAAQGSQGKTQRKKPVRRRNGKRNGEKGRKGWKRKHK